MRSKALLISILLGLLAFSTLFAQENLTEEEALVKIAEYEQCIAEKTPVVEALRAEVAALQAEVDQLLARKSELNRQIAELTRAPEFTTYIVKEGDCLWWIAKREYQPRGQRWYLWKMIYDDNRDVIGANPDLILPKQQFRLNQDQNVWERYRQQLAN
jgi:nucleoid-associated protein YgaU